MLQDLYPGLSLEIFLRDLRDIQKFKSGQQLIELDHSEMTLPPRMIAQLEESLLKGVPMATLMGFSEFYHSKFFVNEHVLVPRPETEYMVDLLVQGHQGKVTRLLDVGTGTGVIALSLLKHGVGKQGVAVDISSEALQVAGINRQRLRLKHKLELIKSDRLRGVTGTFDLIVSNPPYIKANSHRGLVHRSVDKHEPHSALYLPDDFYSMWFEDFFQEVRSHLKGIFMMEGHELELESQAQILEKLGFQKIEIIKDLGGSNRYLRATYY